MRELLFKRSIVSVLKIEESFFKRVKLKEKIPKELLKLNYERFSPFKQNHLRALHQNEILYLWFYPSKIEAKVVIPEAYILFHFFKRDKKNTIFVIESDVTKVLVVGDDEILESFYLRNFDAKILQATKERFGIENEIRLSAPNYQKVFAQALKEFPLGGYIKFMDVGIQKESLLKSAVDTLTYPLASLIAIYILLDLFQTSHLEKEVDRLKKEYQTLKQEREPIKKAMGEYETLKEELSLFKEKELNYFDSTYYLDSLYRAIDGKAVELVHVEIGSGKLKVVIDIKKNSPVALLNALIDAGAFKEVAITNRARKGNVTTYEARLRRAHGE